MKPQEEIWKDIIGWEGLFQVSNLGRFKALEKKVVSKHGITYSHEERIIKGHIRYGYRVIGLRRPGVHKNVLAHRAIATAFIPNPENKPCINHKDGNKGNNDLSNLEWVTYSENLQHAYDNNLKKPAQLGKFGSKHHRSKKVAMLTMSGKLIKTFDSMSIAGREMGFDRGNISGACNGRLKSLGGYKWVHADKLNQCTQKKNFLNGM